MGVDYYACNSCGETFPDCGDYTHCECGMTWCDDSCAEGEGYQREEDGFTPDGSKWSQDTSCNYCRKEDFDNSTLLNFVLENINKTRAELISDFKKK